MEKKNINNAMIKNPKREEQYDKILREVKQSSKRYMIIYPYPTKNKVGKQNYVRI